MFIVLPGKPVHQERVRIMKYGKKPGSDRHGFVRYDPNARDKAYTRTYLTNYLDEHYPDRKMIDFARVSFIFHFPPKKNMTKYAKAIADKGLLKHQVKPDIDNLIKYYLDVMDGIVFVRDQRVSIGFALKTYHEIPKTFIHIQETKWVVEPWEFNQVFYRPPGHETTFSDEQIAFDAPKIGGNPAGNTKEAYAKFTPTPVQEFLGQWEKAYSMFRGEHGTETLYTKPDSPAS